MTYENLLHNIKDFQNTDKSIISSLYELLKKSLPTLLLFSILLTFTLYPLLKSKIVIWLITLCIVIAIRIYFYYQFMNHPNKYVYRVWYRYFYIGAIATAVVFSALGYLLIYNIDSYTQLFIVTSLLGISLGANSSLSPSITLNITYISILMLPTTIIVFFLDNMPYNIVLGIALMLYFISQILYVYQLYKQSLIYKKLSYDENILHYLFDSSPLAILSYDKSLTITDRNEQINILFEHKDENILGLNLNTLKDKRPVKVFQDALSHGPQSYVGSYTSLAGKQFWIEMTVFPYIKRDNIVGGIAIIHDKTKEHNALLKLEYKVEHDSLTGLLNRRGFSNLIKRQMKYKDHKTYYSILYYLDLNQFKAINDSLGHSIGDRVLLIVSKRLTSILDNKCVISRLGGDEFVIMVPYISKDKSISEKKSNEYALKINNIFQSLLLLRVCICIFMLV